MIRGVGTDIVAVARMTDMHARFGARLARRVLSAGEWDEYAAVQHKDRFLARRFAAKEALAKALGTGLRAPVTLSNIGIGHDALGRPEYLPAHELGAWLAERGIVRLHLSISDEHHYAVAFAIAES
ncbi:MAG TPA: holo-ACP synthase [Thiobacillaceae bacterium]|nr:holo-ACP synthase [Thiobacillaceae bacterium]